MAVCQTHHFSWGAAVIAAIVVSFPLVYQSMRVGFESVDPELEDSARSAGAGEWQVLRWITAPLVRRAGISAFILAFARGLGNLGQPGWLQAIYRALRKQRPRRFTLR